MTRAEFLLNNREYKDLSIDEQIIYNMYKVEDELDYLSNIKKGVLKDYKEKYDELKLEYDNSGEELTLSSKVSVVIDLESLYKEIEEKGLPYRLKGFLNELKDDCLSVERREFILNSAKKVKDNIKKLDKYDSKDIKSIIDNLYEIFNAENIYLKNVVKNQQEVITKEEADHYRNKDQLKQLKEELKEIKIENFKVNGIRSLRLFKKTAALASPFIIVGALTFGCAKVSDVGNPFVLEEEMYYPYIEETIDVDGNLIEKENYYAELGEFKDNYVVTPGNERHEEDRYFYSLPNKEEDLSREDISYLFSASKDDLDKKLKNEFKSFNEDCYVLDTYLPTDGESKNKILIYDESKSPILLPQTNSKNNRDKSDAFLISFGCIMFSGLAFAIDYLMVDYQYSYSDINKTAQKNLKETKKVKKKIKELKSKTK